MSSWVHSASVRGAEEARDSRAFAVLSSQFSVLGSRFFGSQCPRIVSRARVRSFARSVGCHSRNDAGAKLAGIGEVRAISSEAEIWKFAAKTSTADPGAIHITARQTSKPSPRRQPPLRRRLTTSLSRRERAGVWRPRMRPYGTKSLQIDQMLPSCVTSDITS
jgi:hypothetical protein